MDPGPPLSPRRDGALFRELEHSREGHVAGWLSWTGLHVFDDHAQASERLG